MELFLDVYKAKRTFNHPHRIVNHVHTLPARNLQHLLLPTILRIVDRKVRTAVFCGDREFGGRGGADDFCAQSYRDMITKNRQISGNEEAALVGRKQGTITDLWRAEQRQCLRHRRLLLLGPIRLCMHCSRCQSIMLKPRGGSERERTRL